MTCFLRKYHEALFKANKPYQYVGDEFLSVKKDFDSAKVRFALVFPDKYEIGISNLGLRVLYNCLNAREEFMADRAYAPEKDFQPETLYGLESKRPLKEFDAVGFSLQYELSYPTVLKMLEMSGIPYRNDERGEDDPIIMAGGPCTFNPLPMADFIDVFMIGDGEDSIVEACEILERTKGLPRAERIKALVEGENSGRWSASVGGGVKKRIAQLKYETAPKTYPIPFSSSVQDRAVVEIRRGCGRMCRFCQPGHVTLPIRERTGEEIVKITRELVDNTGYDEYSLLSLSSNDYSNIKEVIKELAVDFDERKISVSLPSQRIDGFNLELANLVQSVRKSTMTLAPEAGSQRLRNVIKKNISEEQILHAVLTLYENGWSRVKFYFICGLPTETLEDMDELAELLNKIKYRAKLLKKEKGLLHSLDLTCTLSIFVPKPFTPFQWCGQMNLDEVTEHIHYLKDKTKHIKGLKINYHEKYVSEIEAVLTRGDEKLCHYIEALYKKGCYLDAWGENFDKNVWKDTAVELGFSLAGLAQKTYCVNEPLPWDFVDIGVNKDWFINEYNLAMAETSNEFRLTPTCEHKCVGCGVCPNLKTRKVLAPKYEHNAVAKPPRKPEEHNAVPFRYRLKLTKCGILKYFSHLDWQNTFFKSVSRSGLNVAFSYGYNPTMRISMGVALPLFSESVCELVDIDIWDDLTPDELQLKLEKVLPSGCKIVEIKKIDRSYKSIDNTAQWGEYKIEIFNKDLYDFETLCYNTDKVLSSHEIFIEKKNKKGLLKKTDIKNSIKSYKFVDGCLFIILKTGQGSEIPAVRADVVMELIAPGVQFNITRIAFFDENLEEL